MSRDARYIWVAVGSAYSPTAAADIPLYLSTSRFGTKPTDTPPNQAFWDQMKDPGRVKRTMFADGTTMGRGKIASGDLVLSNKDGTFDGWRNYGFDGRTWTLYYGLDTAAFPSGFVVMFVGEVDQAEWDLDSFRLKFRDKQARVEVPLQTTKYAGDNALPAGLEGVAGDLKGKPKPLLYGKVRNIAPPCVNTSKQIYQPSSLALNSVDAVRDGGVSLHAAFPPTWEVDTFDFYSTYNINFAAAYSSDLNRWCIAQQLGFQISDDGGSTWIGYETDTSSGTVDSWIGIIWGRGLFVASANANGMIAYSPNGQIWKEATSPFAGTDSIARPAYSSSLDRYVVGGTAGKLFRSTNAGDPSTWTAAVTNPLTGSDDVIDVLWVADLTLFIAVTTNNKIVTSPDGITWTARTSAHAGTRTLSGIAYDHVLGVAVIVGDGSTTGDSCQTSTNGTSWTARTVPSALNTRPKVIMTPWRYFMITDWTPHIFTSADGTTWADQGATEWSSSRIYNLETDGEIVIAVGNDKKWGAWRIGPGIVYTSEADLLDDTKAPPASGVGFYLAGGLIRLGSVPIQQITCDATQGANAAARTAAQLWSLILSGQLGFTGGQWSASDVTAADAANSAVCGLWTGTDDWEGASALDWFAKSIGAGWWPDLNGVLRFRVLTVPTITGAALTLTEEDIFGLKRSQNADDGGGRSPYRTVLKFCKNYTPQSLADLGGSVTDALRSEFGEDWKSVTSTDATVQVKHPRAPELTLESGIDGAADAATEVARVEVMRGTDREFLEFTTPFNTETIALDIGSVFTLKLATRYGLSAGQAFVIIGLEAQITPDAQNLFVECWG